MRKIDLEQPIFKVIKHNKDNKINECILIKNKRTFKTDLKQQILSQNKINKIDIKI